MPGSVSAARPRRTLQHAPSVTIHELICTTHHSPFATDSQAPSAASMPQKKTLGPTDRQNAAVALSKTNVLSAAADP